MLYTSLGFLSFSIRIIKFCKKIWKILTKTQNKCYNITERTNHTYEGKEATGPYKKDMWIPCWGKYSIKEVEQMFEIGDYIVYGHNGTCQVEDITYLDMSGADKDRLYYVLLPVNRKGNKVYSPVDSNKVKARKILTREEADELISEIPDLEQLWISNDKLREEQYKDAMKDCDCRQWVRIIKTLYLRKKERIAQGKKVTSVDEHYLKLAENQLYGELSVVMGVDKDEMEGYIIQRITALKDKDTESGRP